MKKIRIKKNDTSFGDGVYSIGFIPTKTIIFGIGKNYGDGKYYCHHPQNHSIFQRKEFKDPEKAIQYGLKKYKEWCQKVIKAIDTEKEFERVEEEYQPSPMSMYGA